MAFVARTIKQIEDSIVADKETRVSLSSLTSTSQSSRWRTWISLYATALHHHETLFQSLERELDTRSLSIRAGTTQWYSYESLKFQYGDTLEFIDGDITYSVIDESKKIVTFASAEFNAGYVIIKAAKSDASGLATPLSAVELDAFKNYWKLKKFAQTALSFISQPGDIARAFLNIGINSSVINQSNGESIISPGTYPVVEAIRNYFSSFQIDNFSGVFTVVGLINAIQAVTGVTNVVPISVLIKPINGSFVEVIDDVDNSYVPVSGFLQEDPTLTIESTITYYNG